MKVKKSCVKAETHPSLNTLNSQLQDIIHTGCSRLIQTDKSNDYDLECLNLKIG